jgi:hypothetical protein
MAEMLERLPKPILSRRFWSALVRLFLLRFLKLASRDWPLRVLMSAGTSSGALEDG